MASRYEGNELLRLLEFYVIDTIGELPSHDRGLLEKMTPYLQRTFKAEGDWRSVVAAAMHFKPEIDDCLRLLWARNQNIANEHGQQLSPEEFARMIVDRNFANQ